MVGLVAEDFFDPFSKFRLSAPDAIRHYLNAGTGNLRVYKHHCRGAEKNGKNLTYYPR